MEEKEQEKSSIMHAARHIRGTTCQVLIIINQKRILNIKQVHKASRNKGRTPCFKNFSNEKEEKKKSACSSLPPSSRSPSR